MSTTEYPNRASTAARVDEILATGPKRMSELAQALSRPQRRLLDAVLQDERYVVTTSPTSGYRTVTRRVVSPVDAEIARRLATAPPLTPEQGEYLARVFRVEELGTEAR